MKLDRAQTLITRCPNDIVCLRVDGQAFRSVQIQDIQCGDQFAYRARFNDRAKAAMSELICLAFLSI